YICQHGSSFVDYHDLLIRTEEVVLSWFDADVMKYPKSVAVTWQASVDQLYPNSRSLLQLLAELAPSPIPIEMIVSFAPETGVEGAGIAQPAKAVRELEDYSLAKGSIDGHTIFVHRLVQDVTRLRVSRKEEDLWRRAALGIINKYSANISG